MKSIFFTLIMSVLSLYSHAQMTRTSSVSGTITVPCLSEIDVDFAVNDFALRFDTWEQMVDGRVYPNALHVYIKSNQPWVVKVKSKDAFQQPVTPNGSPDVSANLISIKKPEDSQFVPLTTAPQTILVSTNNNIENHYYLDLKMDTNWNSNGGTYNLNVNFSLSAP